MAKAARERLARLLAGEEAVAFSAQLSVPSDTLHLEVDGVGQVRLPVRQAQAKKLCGVARPAHFGHREETILDPAVRDTWEISPDLVSLGGPSWAPALEGALTELADELGVPAGNRLEAELHALLVYGPGQFFVPHQDTEKNDAMIGTLTVTLPSSHTGGEFIVEHGGQSVTYRSSRDSLSLVAFYADCLHQVTPVRTGYRVVLTFNLLMRGTPATGSADGPVPELAGCLAEHFSSPEQVRYGSSEPPKRLVYLLDHKYTERGLRWDKLKGADAERATLLRAAADKADCETVLALAEIKETWDTEARKITYLIDSSLTLDWWTSPSGGEAISLYIRDAEICASTPTAELKPYQSEYTGYMGNWGGTKDRWYRRAAIVMWTRERSFAAQAEASGLWALDELRRLADAGDLAAARAAASSVESFWAVSVSAQPRAFERTLNVAVVLDAPETATMLLRPFCVEMLTPDHAGALLALAGHYGPEWMGGMLAVWFGERSRAYHDAELRRPEWLASLPGLCEALGGEGGVTRGLLTRSWRWLSDQIRIWLGNSAVTPGRRISANSAIRWRACWKPPPWPARPACGMRSSVSCASAATNCARSWSRCCGVRRRCPRPTGRLRAWTRSRACARRASASSSHGRCAPRTTGRSRGAIPAAVNCVSRSASSSAIAPVAHSNGRSPRRAASTSSSRSARRSCLSGIRPCARAARTP